ncbi:MAG: class I SAM-dependent methyltransferase [Xanthomonadales bacterium]|nr:class I SAM-dependent methyltransferase [Xanthomonadales bacterium]
MRERGRWTPSKYVMRGEKLHPNRDRRELAVSSRLIARLITDKYQSAFRQYAHGLLLDMGCGKVPFYEGYRECVSENICIDWPGSIHNNVHVDVFCDLSQTLPFAAGTFDTLLSSDVIEHLPNPELAFSEMSRLLKPNGILLLNTPFLYMLHEVPNDYYRFTRYAIKHLLDMAGLELVRLEEIGGYGAVITDLVSKAMSALPLIGPPMASLIQGIGLLASGGLRSTPALIRFPIGYFLVAQKPGSGIE